MQDVLKETEVKMQKSIEAMKKSFLAIRTGRANPALLDHVQVEYYGTKVPLKQLASVAAPEPRMLLLTPYDKSAAQAIANAISSSDLGINPKIEGTVIRLTLPELSEERRKEMIKIIKKEAEDAKISVRNGRREALDFLKKQKADKVITEDEEKGKDKKIQEMTDKHSAEIDKLFGLKEKEVLEV